MMQATVAAAFPLLTLVCAGLSDQEIGRLLQLRRQILAGLVNEDPMQHPRAAFIRYLVQEGIVHD